MARRKPAVAVTPHVRPDADWLITDTVQANGREVTPGTELTITGEGTTRFVFVRLVRLPSGIAWIDVLETWKGIPQAYRSFRPERIKTVHRIAKTRPSSQAA